MNPPEPTLKLYTFITSPNGRKVEAMVSHLMRILPMIAFGVAVTAEPICVQAATYPPVQAYMIPKDEEVALARTAAPANISGSATIKVLGLSGYKVEVSGTNGFVCSVMRGFTAPTYTPKDFRDLVYDPSVRAPICFNPLAAEVVMPYYELRTELGLKGQSPDQIMSGVQAAYATGKLPKRDAVSFGYMWSALRPDGRCEVGRAAARVSGSKPNRRLCRSVVSRDLERPKGITSGTVAPLQPSGQWTVAQEAAPGRCKRLENGRRSDEPNRHRKERGQRRNLPA